MKRRVRIISFSGYFNQRHGLRDEYGGEVPDVLDSPERIKREGWVDENGEPVDWDKSQGEFRGYDWDGYFSYLADAVKAYLGAGRLPSEGDLKIWLKGFDLRYGGRDSYFRDAIEDRYEHWADQGVVPSKDNKSRTPTFGANSSLVVSGRKGRKRQKARAGKEEK